MPRQSSIFRTFSLTLSCLMVLAVGAPHASAGSGSGTSEQVVHIQEMLIWTGDLNGEVGRVPASELVEAIQTFQKKQGSAPTGKLTSEQVERLTRAGRARRSAAGFSVSFDDETQVRVGLPLANVAKKANGTWGPHWQSADGQIDINLLKIPTSAKSLDELYQRMKSLPGRRITYDKRAGSWFVIEGEDGKHACFHVRAEANSAEIRGMSIVHKRQPRDKDCVTKHTPVVNAVASSFESFPKGASVATGGIVSRDNGTSVASAAFPTAAPEPRTQMSEDLRSKWIEKQIKELVAAALNDYRAGSGAQASPANPLIVPGAQVINLFEGRRRAFVVGIDQYSNLDQRAQLATAVSDAREIGQTLKQLGFEVSLNPNVDRSSFVRRWSEFLSSVQPGDTVTFFIAGHGIEFNRDNYVLPASVPKVEAGQEEWLKKESIRVAEILDETRQHGARLRILILDACRDNPFQQYKGRTIGGTRGLAKMDAAEGEVILYSAAAGQQALDSLKSDGPSDKNSVFTRFLLRHMVVPGLDIVEMAGVIRREVAAAARADGHPQVPAVYSDLNAKYCLAGGCSALVSSAGNPR